MKVVFILTCALLSGFAAYYGQPLASGNSDAITIIVTVMTVFAGFLVAIISILGDPAMIPKGSWTMAEARHKKLESIIIRHTTLFYLYLIAIAFLFGGVLIDKEPNAAVSAKIKSYIEYASLFFGVFSFLLTLALPKILGDIQMARSEAEIEQRRIDEGIKPTPDS